MPREHLLNFRTQGSHSGPSSAAIQGPSQSVCILLPPYTKKAPTPLLAFPKLSPGWNSFSSRHLLSSLRCSSSSTSSRQPSKTTSQPLDCSSQARPTGLWDPLSFTLPTALVPGTALDTTEMLNECLLHAMNVYNL